MAQFLIRDSLNPQKVVNCGITFEQVTPRDYEGEPIWVVELATDEPHKNGGAIPPEYINLTSLDNLDLEIEKAVENISDQIDWTPLEEDTRAPLVDSVYPTTYEVTMDAFIEMIIKDLLPSAGIDIDSIQMTINDFDVTDDLTITGDPYEYKLVWKPPIRVYESE